MGPAQKSRLGPRVSLNAQGYVEIMVHVASSLRIARSDQILSIVWDLVSCKTACLWCVSSQVSIVCSQFGNYLFRVKSRPYGAFLTNIVLSNSEDSFFFFWDLAMNSRG